MTETVISAPSVEGAELAAQLRVLSAGREEVDLRGRDLRGLDLSSCDLRKALLAGADLSGANLSGCNLDGVDLTDASLFRTNLHLASLRCARLVRAECTGADFRGADLNECEARGAGLGMGDFTGAHLSQAKLDDCTLTSAVLVDADFCGTSLKRSRLREVDMSGADFNSADLRKSDLALSRVAGTSFRNADLRDARLRALRDYRHADWIGTDMRDINFAGSYQLRRFAVDQNYLFEFQQGGWREAWLYRLWWLSSDCGRSLSRWCCCILLVAFAYAGLYTGVVLNTGTQPTWFEAFYFSVVTLTTLGYGDLVPAETPGRFLVISEVLVGYVLLGGMLSIFANKLARRAD